MELMLALSQLIQVCERQREGDHPAADTVELVMTLPSGARAWSAVSEVTAQQLTAAFRARLQQLLDERRARRAPVGRFFRAAPADMSQPNLN
ncbi:hypothetical protein [Streptomyces syringium]|uniref:hypothetical protein n=1 Tax=Streptomyces syringium TaxID=76729 RepID=UPI0037D8FFC4